MSAKIVARIFGGLGNQLFCYAAARRLALVNNAELLIDHVSGFRNDTAYRREYQLDNFNIRCGKATPNERLEPFSSIRRNFWRQWNRHIPFEKRNYIRQEGVDFDPRLLDLRVVRPLYLEGYWQSEGYFKDVEAQIRQDLRIRPPSDGTNLAYAERMRQTPTVAVHVRFFDEPESVENFRDNNVPSSYYARAVQFIEAQVSGAHYFLFSDHPEVARNRIPLPDNRVTTVHHNNGEQNSYADLWLMSQCQHFIIANSTFSWWGAWLAPNINKLVIAPDYKIGGAGKVTSWGFKGLLPGNWILR